MNKIYALYKGDEFIFMGTIQEMSKKLEMKLQELYKIKSRTKLGLVKEKGMVLFEVEGEDEWVKKKKYRVMANCWLKILD